MPSDPTSRVLLDAQFLPLCVYTAQWSRYPPVNHFLYPILSLSYILKDNILLRCQHKHLRTER